MRIILGCWMIFGQLDDTRISDPSPVCLWRSLFAEKRSDRKCGTHIFCTFFPPFQGKSVWPSPENSAQEAMREAVTVHCPEAMHWVLVQNARKILEDSSPHIFSEFWKGWYASNTTTFNHYICTIQPALAFSHFQPLQTAELEGLKSIRAKK